MKRMLSALLGVAVLAMGGPASSQQANDGWSNWFDHREHLQFSVKTESVAPGVMVLRVRIRPNVESIRAIPAIASSPYFVEYYQAVDRARVGGRGDTDSSNTRRIVFPVGASEACVWEDPTGLFAPDQGKGPDRLYRRDGIFVPIFNAGGTEISGMDMVLEWTARGTGNARYVGPNQIARGYTAACR